MIVEVLVEIKAWKIDKTFSYHVPSALEKEIAIGKRVLVPFQKRELEGFIINILDEVAYETKDIIKVIDENPVLNEELLELGKYISKKTLCNLISAYETMLPVALKAKNGTTINKRYQTYLEVNSIDIKLTPKQLEIVELIKKQGRVLKSSIKSSVVSTLIKKNVLKEVSEEVYRLNNEKKVVDQKINLTSEQELVFNKIKESVNQFQPFLLFGVTGSGKTLVYIKIIEYVLHFNKEVIVLVPEISLTPQIVSRFKKKFGNLIAILHSGLSAGEKYDEWRKIERGEVKIVIGARSAIFAPFKNLGLIVIDEEHSDSYKQENNPKYSTIDIALWRAKYHNCCVVLGSATPSIESYVRAKNNIYTLLEMKNRYNNNFPDIHLINMRDSIKNGYKIISKELFDAINLRLERHEQTIILLNRRGYATNITCHDCGYVVKCKYCDIPLTYHKSSNTLRCHYCGYALPLVKTCPVCKSKNIDYFGLGTQRLEEELNRMFKARIVRMDVDTTSKKGAHEKIIKDFLEQKYDILLGTQMIAKGLDFPNVTLVGVINGDATLNMPDFRSGERTFQLLNQIAGRSGRATKKGEVFIQAFNTDHYSIVLATKNDYETFAKEELLIRKMLKYPPFYNLLIIKVLGKNEENVISECNKCIAYLNSNIKENVYILGPAPAYIPKINNIYYYQITLKYKNTKDIIKEMHYLNKIYSNNKLVKIEIDFNPIKI
ncbi:MAG: primosomal protein N' [Erysipelotrichaceae bacterium]|nr:primosomal protein N' [Erysipelotrichaceae bacterium]